MTRSTLPLPEAVDYRSNARYESAVLPGVTFAVRRPSLAQRISLTTRARDLTLKNEFLKAGDVSDQLAISLSDLLVRKLYLEWGLLEIDGLTVNGEAATSALLIEHGPEDLTEEILAAIKTESWLNEDERKNF